MNFINPALDDTAQGLYYSNMEQYSVPVATSQAVIGYIVNFGLSNKLADAIATIQQRLVAIEPTIWIPPRKALHCTLLDILAPKVDYGSDKDALFSSQQARYIEGLHKIAAAVDPLSVQFNQIQIFPEAIIISGADSGQFAQMREQYITAIPLLAGTKPPPKIIHVTIAKFTQRVPLSSLSNLDATLSIAKTERFTSFRLVRETDIFMQAFSTIDTFQLGLKRMSG